MKLSIQTRKKILLIVMAVTIVLPALIYLTHPVGVRAGFNSKLASTLGYTALMILLWQYLLGIRFFVSKVLTDLVWVNKLHQRMGIYGALIIFSHPIVVFATRGILQYLPNLSDPYLNYILLGEIAALLVLTTWLGSAFIRRKIPYRTWKRLHLFNYLILPLALLHALNIGRGVTLVPALRTYFMAVSILYIVALLVRLTSQLGLGKTRAMLLQSVSKANRVKELIFSVDPHSNLLHAKPGQFLYINVRPFGENHPFTITKVDPRLGTVSITPKAVGPFTKCLHELEPVARVFLDGPYGVFTSKLNQKTEDTGKPVFIAGGIGITPFIRHIEQRTRDNQAYVLFYAAQTEADMVLYDYLKQAATNPEILCVPVMSSQEDFSGEKGLITPGLIKKYLKEDLSNFDYFVCGPEPMMKMVISDLKKSGVPKKQIDSERFSL